LQGKNYDQNQQELFRSAGAIIHDETECLYGPKLDP